MQTKKHSFYEALSNTAIGFIISLSATFVIFPLLDIPTTSGQNIVITLFFTVISIIRGYVIRRWFNEAPAVEINNDQYCSDFRAKNKKP